MRVYNFCFITNELRTKNKEDFCLNSVSLSSNNIDTTTQEMAFAADNKMFVENINQCPFYKRFI